MFERRNSHKPTLDLLSSFKDSFAILQQLKFDPSLLPASPEPSTPAAEANMGYDQTSSHFDDGSDNHFDMEMFHSQAEAYGSHRPDTLGVFGGLGGHSYDPSSYYAPTTIGPGPQHSQPQLVMTPHSGTFPFTSGHNYLNDFPMQTMQAPDVPHQFTFGTFDGYPHQVPALYGYDSNQGSVNPSRLDVERPMSLEQVMPQDFSPFRFHVVLMTGTSMNVENEHQVSYLNKCQPYKITIKDTRPTQSRWTQQTTYRTFIRACFNNNEKRKEPATGWKTWAVNRGVEEASKRTPPKERLQAIEYVAQTKNQHNAAVVTLVEETLDGFCITWNSQTNRQQQQPECEFQFRCNFLSTDFSNSKGVKGISMRLAAKTVVADPGSGSLGHFTEMSYCQVKCFRDHGAERKLANDDAHVNKIIEKCKAQLKQMQQRPTEPGNEASVLVSAPKKRKRTESMSSAARSKKARNQKEQREQREDSEMSDSPILPNTLDGDLQAKLDQCYRLLRSKLDITAFTMEGDTQDDPEKYPLSTDLSLEVSNAVAAPAQNQQLAKTNAASKKVSAYQGEVSGATSVVSGAAPQSVTDDVPPTAQSESPARRKSLTEDVKAELGPVDGEPLASSIGSRRRSETQWKTKLGSNEEIVVGDLDPSYVPPPKRTKLPIACFYVRTSINKQPSSNDFYRAIYLYERTVSAFTKAIALKNNIAPNHVRVTLHRRKRERNGTIEDIEIKVDDEMISEMLEGQDLEAELLGETEQSGRSTPHTLYKLTVFF